MSKGKVIWRHVVISTKGRWLHGDERGFRSRGHRIHSSGDHKHRPPRGEHERLHRYHEGRSPDEVIIPEALRLTIVEAFALALIGMGWRVLVASCSDKHLHALAELPTNRAQTKRIVGDAKRIASREVRREMPGSVWSAGGEYKPIKNRDHQVETFFYILERQEVGARVWHFRRPAN